LTLHGPPPITRSVRAGIRAHAFDTAIREADEGRPRFADLVRVHTIRDAGVVHRDEQVTVTAARVDHPPIEDAYAYRFDAGGWSVVISGDTAPSAALVRLAQGADVLVHEVLLADAAEVATWVGKPIDHPLVQHIVRSHTSVHDVGRIAREAGAGTLVLSHYVPGDAQVERDAVLAEIRAEFAGEVVFGEDLLVLTPREDR
jgi:ribonuclease BN (tRNA processing enzyme)